MSVVRVHVRPGERVYAALKEGLLDGRYHGGQRLNADALAAELGASRQPVFDAFRRLSTEGFLVVRPHVGCHVVDFDLTEVRDYFHLFAALEGEAAALASERRSEEQLRELRRLHAQIGGLTSLREPDERAQAYRTLNRGFHSVIHAMCRTAIVESFGAGMYDRADFYINSAASRSPFSDSVPERHHGHDRIVAALEARDTRAARAAATGHIFDTVALIQAEIERDATRSVDDEPQ